MADEVGGEEGTVRPPPPSRAQGASALQARSSAGRAHGSLAFGSRPLALAIGAILLATTFTAGVLGFRDHRSDGHSRAGPDSTAPETTAPALSKAVTKCRQPSDIPAAAGKPTDIPVPPKPVRALKTRDLRNGQGPAATDGDKLTLQYVGLSCASGKQVDASWDRREPIPVTLGAGSVIPGWDQGIKGMKVGGRRLLWIPAALAYGAAGQPPDIAPGDTLIFVIDLLKIG